MAVQLRGTSYRILFRHQGKQFSFSLGSVAEREALAKSAQVDYLVLRLAQRLIELPLGMGIVDFVRFDGKTPEAVTKAVTNLDLGRLRDLFLAARAGGREANTQATTAIHFRHLVKEFGDDFPLASLAHSDLQRYVTNRPVSATTSRKEVTTLRTAWHWAVDAGLLVGDFPNKSLVYPKEDELPPYRTLEEIERLLGGTPADDDLWEALYLRPDEVAGLLGHIRDHARHPWIYPLTCMAAHTGARRSELIRAEVADVDFEGGAITIREKKRLKGKRSTRRAPLTPLLAEALLAWLGEHPGGVALFCQAGEVARSRKRGGTTGHSSKNRPTTAAGRAEAVRPRELPPASVLTPSECHDHFKRTLADSPWRVVKGLHTLRHSFISALAAAGVDQRIIDDIVGHTSVEMQRRYRHLVPSVKRDAVASVFGSVGGHPVGTAGSPDG